MLYPLKFKPIFKERVWGGRDLEKLFNKKLPKDKIIGESWELSTLDGDQTIVAEGRLKGNELSEMIEVFMGELVGEAVYDKFGLEMPVLIKFLDVEENLSVQVHPDDEIAKERHNSMGKSEMWYVVEAEIGSCVGVGFKSGVTSETYMEALAGGYVEDIMNTIEVFKGDCFFVPAGTVHYLGKGVKVAEIQQTSDITYRIYDWGRENGDSKREIHTELAQAVLNFDISASRLCITKPPIENNPVNLVNCEHFVTQLLKVNGSMLRDFSTLDSFVAYICVEGSAMLNDTKIVCGETLLIPAITDRVEIKGDAILLETFVTL